MDLPHTERESGHFELDLPYSYSSRRTVKLPVSSEKMSQARAPFVGTHVRQVVACEGSTKNDSVADVAPVRTHAVAGGLDLTNPLPYAYVPYARTGKGGTPSWPSWN